jgi:excisionase family DNA binding protein
MSTESHKLLDVRAAAAYLAISVRTMRKLLSSRSMPHYKIAGCVRIEQGDLDSFLRECRRAPL